MGGASSKQAQLERYGRLLATGERRALEQAFSAITRTPEAKVFSEQQFTVYLSSLLGLPSPVCVCVYRALGSGEAGREQEKLSQVAFPDFIQHASHLLRGSLVQRSQRLHLLCNGQVSTMKEAVQGLLSATLAKLSSHLGTDPGVWPSPEDSVLAVSDRVVTGLGGSEGKGSVLPEDIEAWLAASPIACRIFDVAFSLCLYSEVLHGDQVPEEVSSLLGRPLEEEDEDGVKRLVTERLLLPLRTQHPLLRETFTSSLLTKATLLLLNSHFPVELRGQLYPLFSSLHHGESYSTLCKALVGRGPTLLVVRDQKGYVFGGFAADSWQFGPQFNGSDGCFLFSLLPTLGIYTSTGYNTNYMYLEQSAQTLPNGLGMGGQLEYCGLWLSADFGVGHSRGKPKCTTYGSPSLSATEEFSVDLLEAWGVGPPQLPDEDAGRQTSILDKDKAASHLLEMAGKTRHSEGLREPEEDS